MKAIIKNERPRVLVNVLNGKAKVLVCKDFPKDFKGWVYLYCTKDKWLLYDEEQQTYFSTNKKKGSLECHSINSDYFSNLSYEIEICEHLEGKVVARFWCDRVEHIEYETCSRDISGWWKDNGQMFNHKDACLTYKEMFDYIGSGDGYAIHITKLEVFDKPKELSEFMTRHYPQFAGMVRNKTHYELKPLTKAPQNYCYVEDELK